LPISAGEKLTAGQSQTAETKTDPTIGAIVSSTSLKIVAGAIVIACMYYASSVLITLIVSVLIALVLDPAVDVLERAHLPRWLGSLTMVLFVLLLVLLLGYALYGRAVQFAQQLPTISAKIGTFMEHTENALSHLTQSASPLPQSPQQNGLLKVQLQQQHSPWEQFLLRGIGSVYAFSLTVMLLPFLIFFMLTSKRHLRSATVSLFPEEHHPQIDAILTAVSGMVREYVFGNFLVAVISMALIAPGFALLRLHYAFVLAAISSIFDLAPYIGIALAILPPLLVALVQFNTATPIIVIAIIVSAVHLLSVNVLTPKLVGGRVRLSALSVTIAMMLWGWLWGAMGLVLAVPVTAALKAVCDNVPSLAPVGFWLGDGEYREGRRP
jgi:predicted PurR-regulated permease PerM